MAVETYQLVTSYVCAGQFCQTVNHFNITDPLNSNSFEVAQKFIEALETPPSGFEYLDLLQDILSVDSFISSVRVHRVAPSGGAEAIKVFPAADRPGQFAGNCESSAVAGCVIWVPATPVKLTGRTFYPGVSEDAIENGFWETAYLNAVADMLDGFINDPFESVDGLWKVCVRKGIAPAYTYHEATDAYLSVSPGTIKKRRTPL